MKFKTPLICYDTKTGIKMESDETLLEYYNIFKYKINNDGSLNVFEDVNFAHYGLNYIPFEFNYVGGSFHCHF